MILTQENYFSPEAMTKYFSVSQYKDFVGTMGQRGCEAMALAKMRGEWQQNLTTPLLVGLYCDAHFSDNLNIFKSQHPEILTKAGCLKSDYAQAEEIITRIEKDNYFMKFMEGEQQVIFTGEIFGVQWKCKVDSLDRKKFIADLKIIKSIRESFWVKDHGYMSFVEYWGYNIQAAVYQKIVTMNIGKDIPFFIAVASKESVPDIEIIGFTQYDLDSSLSTIEPNIERIKALKEGRAEPDSCGCCDYCKTVKVLTKPIHFSELILDI
jgi:hypothetical protein